MSSHESRGHRSLAELWISELRAELVEAGHDLERIDRMLRDALDRFRARSAPALLPLLVERSVRRELRDGR